MSLRTIELLDVDGIPIVLSVHDAGPYELAGGSRLHGRSPHRINTRRLGRIPGETRESTEVLPKRFAVPVQVQGTTEQEIDERLGDLSARLSATVDHRLVYTRPDGTTRQITAAYEGGSELTSVQHRDKRFVVVPLQFLALFPYWRQVGVDVEKQVAPINDGYAAGANVITINNLAEIDETWPEWIITGHAENIEALNRTSGLLWRITEVVPLGSELRIDTDPKSFGVWLDDVELFEAADAYSQWWPLLPGVNDIIFRANSNAGVDPVGQVTVRWRPLFESC